MATVTTGAKAASDTAAALAPIIDRIRMTIMEATLTRGMPASFRDAGLDQTTSVMLAYLRNSWPDRAIPRSSVKAVFTYQPDRPVDVALDALADRGILDQPDVGILRLTALGQCLLADLHIASSSLVDDSWAGMSDQITAVAPLVDAALETARATGGKSFTIMSPRRLPDEVSAAGRLAEQITGLRFHRFDAHIAAWRSMGHALDALDSLDDDARVVLEADTNRRAGAAYAGFTDSDRMALIAGLNWLSLNRTA